jgi:hypothetical protein
MATSRAGNVGGDTKEVKTIERERWSRGTLISGQNLEGFKKFLGVVVTASTETEMDTFRLRIQTPCFVTTVKRMGIGP